jgi:hypothetical protein
MNKPRKLPALRSRKSFDRPQPRISERLGGQDATETARELPERKARQDGWSEERIRAFLTTLASYGTVGEAARAAGMSRQSAYKLRSSTNGRGFRLAWSAAIRLAREHLVDLVHSRAVHGCVEVIVRDGQVWGERHRFDNRLTMDVIERLDRQVALEGEDSRTTGMIADRFETFVDLVCAGNEDKVSEFVDANRPRAPGEHSGITVRFIDDKGDTITMEELQRRDESDNVP